jgi:hypothetical protein
MDYEAEWKHFKEFLVALKEIGLQIAENDNLGLEFCGGFPANVNLSGKEAMAGKLLILQILLNHIDATENDSFAEHIVSMKEAIKHRAGD